MSSATLFALVYSAAAAVCLVAVAVIWRRREAAGATSLALMLVAGAFWALCDAVELYVPTTEGKRLVSQFQYVGVVSAAPLFFHAAMGLSGLGERLSRGLFAAVWTVPIASLLFAWTNPWHHWLWTAILPPTGDLPFAIYQYGWWFWVLTAQHYLLMVAASVVLLRAMRHVSHDFRTAMGTLILVVLLPWIGNFAYNLKLGPWPGFNWLTLSLGASGSLLTWIVLREGLLDILPRAGNALLAMMNDGVMVVDSRGRVLFTNEATRLLELTEAALCEALEVTSLQDLPADWRAEVEVPGMRARRWLDLRVGPVSDRWGRIAGRIVVARDVTVQKGLEDEREQLIDELQEAIGKVTQLEGLLPICANCRKIRDDEGMWARMEEYLEKRAPVEFTHSICPECNTQLYPEITHGRIPKK